MTDIEKDHRVQQLCFKEAVAWLSFSRLEGLGPSMSRRQ